MVVQVRRGGCTSRVQIHQSDTTCGSRGGDLRAVEMAGVVVDEMIDAPTAETLTCGDAAADNHRLRAGLA